jgi:hypothetical protein
MGDVKVVEAKRTWFAMKWDGDTDTLEAFLTSIDPGITYSVDGSGNLSISVPRDVGGPAGYAVTSGNWTVSQPVQSVIDNKWYPGFSNTPESDFFSLFNVIYP